MGIGHEAVTALGHALRGVHAGDAKLASHKLGLPWPGTLVVTSTAFADGGRLPISATVDGEGKAPPIAWAGVPDAARSVVLLCEDPDVPFPAPFVHWITYGISLAADDTTEGNVLHEGKNSTMRIGFTPAAPPPGHGLHHYHFQVFALDRDLPLDPGAGRQALLDAMRGHVIAWGEIVGTYERE